MCATKTLLRNNDAQNVNMHIDWTKVSWTIGKHFEHYFTIHHQGQFFGGSD